MRLNTESVLPHEMQFTTMVGDYEEFIDELLQEVSSKNLGEVIDVSYELSCDFEKLYRLSVLLVTLYDKGADDVDHEVAALYRGMLFGMQVTSYIENYKNTPISFSEYFSQTEGNPLDTIGDDVSEYLSSRPQLDALICRYSPEIDKGSRYGHLAELGAGFMLMLSERAEGRAHLAAAVSELSPADFRQEGTG